MSSDRDTTRIVRSWLEDGATSLPDRVLDAVLDQLPATHQRRVIWWPARRIAHMNTAAKFGLAAAVVVVAALLGFNYIVGPNVGAPGLDDSSPSPSLLARGTFKLYEAEVELSATEDGYSVTGTMTVSHANGDFSVDLKCTRTTEDGVILIAGDITDSTSPYARTGAREVLVLKPGSPVHASFDSEGRAGGDVTPAASCPALLQQVIDTGSQTVIGPNGLEPIEGSVEFGP